MFCWVHTSQVDGQTNNKNGSFYIYINYPIMYKNYPFSSFCWFVMFMICITFPRHVCHWSAWYNNEKVSAKGSFCCGVLHKLNYRPSVLMVGTLERVFPDLHVCETQTDCSSFALTQSYRVNSFVICQTTDSRQWSSSHRYHDLLTRLMAHRKKSVQSSIAKTAKLIESTLILGDPRRTEPFILTVGFKRK